MRHKGSISDFMEDRNREILEAFAFEISRNSEAVRDIWEKIARHSASRFYVSEPRALAVIRHRVRTGRFPVMNHQRRKMFEEIYRRYIYRRNASPAAKDEDIIFDVVNSPAPSFYLTAKSIRTLIYSLRA